MPKKENVIERENRASPPPVPPAEAAASNIVSSSDSNQNAFTADRTVIAWLQNPTILLLLLGLLTFLLYVGTLTFQFVMDDNLQVVNNLVIRNWHNVPSVWGRDLWQNFTRSQQVYYRPLFTTWSILNYSLFQLYAWGWHLGTVLMHIFAALSVFFLARKLGLEYWTAALATLVFAFHPVHVECASCISAASDPMVTLFFAWAFLAFLYSREQQQGKSLAWSSVSILLLACALFTKEMGLTFLAIVALYVWLFPLPPERTLLGRMRQSVVAALPYGLISVAYLLVRKLILHQVAASVDRSRLVDMVVTWPMVLYNYVRMLLFPVGLGGLYYHPYVEKPGLSNFWLPLLVVAAFAIGIWYWSRRTGDRLIAFAGLWMIVTVAPALYLPSFGNGDFVHDRYIYLPSIGFAILLAKAIRLLPGIKSLSPTAAQTAAACVLAVAYFVGSYYTQVYWSSNLLVYYRGHTLYPQYEFATVGYADELSKRGSYERAAELFKSVINNHREDDASGLFSPYFDLAGTYFRAGDIANGKATLAKAAALARATPAPAQNMIFVAGLYGQVGDYTQALALCSDALQKDSSLYAALDMCGNIQLLAGHYPEAEKLLSQAVRMAPDRAAPRHLLGRVYFQTGRDAEAETSFRTAVTLDSTVYDYHYWYARALMQRGDTPDARRELLHALALKSDAAEAKAALATLPASR